MSDPQNPKPWNVSGDKSVSGSTSNTPVGAGRPDRSPEPYRPLGITIVCMINFVVAGLFLLLIVMSLTTGTGDKSIAFLAIVPALMSAGLGIALWQMLPWARNTALVVYGVYALSAMLNLFRPNVSPTDILSLIVPGAIAAYLLHPSVQAAFDRNVKR
jgi:hypothetical protein